MAYPRHWPSPVLGHFFINARAETVLEKPYFKSAIEKRRCLIPVTGFFEWHREGKAKTP
jgi:putative SOS response-associated peptidase YedK